MVRHRANLCAKIQLLRVDQCVCVKRHTLTSLEVRIWTGLVAGKNTCGKLLVTCGMDRESVDPRFLASIGVRLLPAVFAGLGKNSIRLGGGLLLLGRLYLDLLLSVRHKGSLEAWQLAPKAGCTLSTCAEVEVNKRRFENSAAKRSGKIAAGRDVVAIRNTSESMSRHLTVGRFRVVCAPIVTCCSCTHLHNREGPCVTM